MKVVSVNVKPKPVELTQYSVDLIKQPATVGVAQRTIEMTSLVQISKR